MNFEDLLLYLNNNSIDYKLNVNVAEYLSFKVGGTCPIIAFPNTIHKFCNLISFVNNKIKYFILGCGTNCYFSNYYDGIIISTKYLNEIYMSNNKIKAECGASLTRCAVYAYEKSLSGIEFLYGIPGSVGGGVYMNASAFGSMMSQVISECYVYDIDKQNFLVLKSSELCFDIKKSIFMTGNNLVLSATFDLTLFDKKIIKEKMDVFLNKRINSQPLNLPNAGSTFKRPKNGYASELIDRAGLKGFYIGDAEISSKHAGFIVNKGNATSNDVNALIIMIKKIVKEKYDVDLEEEIIYVE